MHLHADAHAPSFNIETRHSEAKVVDGDAGGEKYRAAAEKTMMHRSAIPSEKRKIIYYQEVVHH